MDQNRVPMSPEASQAFTEIAQDARLTWHAFDSFGEPVPGPNFDHVNDLYPFEKVSDRARHYISAALEHLIMWADLAAPLKFHPEQTTTFTMRPTYALARAAPRWRVPLRRSGSWTPRTPSSACDGTYA